MGKYWVGFDEVGWWDRMFDGDLRQRRDINEAMAQNESLVAGVGQLGRQIDAMKKQMFDLQMVNGVLLKMLSEAGQLDLQTLRYRVEAEIDLLRADQDERAQQGATMPASITCPRCQRSVPPSQTTMTENGVVCDACAR